MKKNLFTIAAVGCLLIVSSTTVKAQDDLVTFGIKGGANLSTYGGDISKTKNVFKYQFGVTADIALTENLYVISGLEFQTKGSKSEPRGLPNVKYNPMYLQMPMHMAYKFDVNPRNRLVVQAGPYIAYGIAGKMKSAGEKVNIFGDDRFKRFDLGIGAGVGWEFNHHFVVKAGYDFGLLDVCDVKGIKARNQNGYVTVGYRF